MRISKIKIKNLFGIKEYEANGQSVELDGRNGAGKTSVIDASRYAVTNKASRTEKLRGKSSLRLTMVYGLTVKPVPHRQIIRV